MLFRLEVIVELSLALETLVANLALQLIGYLFVTLQLLVHFFLVFLHFFLHQLSLFLLPLFFKLSFPLHFLICELFLLLHLGLQVSLVSLVVSLNELNELLYLLHVNLLSLFSLFQILLLDVLNLSSVFSLSFVP